MGNTASHRPEKGKEWPLTGLTEDQIRIEAIKGTLYGNCVGDAIGLLTEFMTKEEAKKYYFELFKQNGILHFSDKVPDFHRSRWEDGDWTDDSDQMLLILKSLISNEGKVLPTDYAKLLYGWMTHGMEEFNDIGGMGIGRTTVTVLNHPDFRENPHRVAYNVWDSSGRNIAPNGAVMRTSILGILSFQDLDQVIENATKICKVTHADRRCVASCVAVCVAIALMLQRKSAHLNTDGSINTKKIILEAYSHAIKELEDETHIADFKHYMLRGSNIRELKLCEAGKIGYTFKTMGAGFWALRQNNFKEAMQTILFEGGDADTNGAVAGALLGCKLGAKGIPETWLTELKYKDWLDAQITKFFQLLKTLETTKSENEPSELKEP